MNIFNKRKSLFSLIEMMAVLIISAIIIGISMPAINSILKGQGVEQGARIIGTTLKATRNYAISQRKNIALIIPTESLSSDYLNVSFRLCAIDDNSGTYTFSYWLPNEKWEFMPVGVAIIDIDNSSTYDTGNFSAASEITNVDFSDISSSVTTSNSTGIIFKPTGKCVGQRKYIVIGNSNVLSGALPGDNQINVVIDQYNGRVSYEEN